MLISDAENEASADNEPEDDREETSESEPVLKRPAAKVVQVKKIAPVTTAAKSAPKAKSKVEKEPPVKRPKRSTFAGRRCPEGDVPKARFLSMMETYTAMITPKLESPSQFEASLIGECIFKGMRFRFVLLMK